MEKNLFFIDVETDGLYGDFISAAVLVASPEGRELERHYYGIAREVLQVTDGWTREHVLPILGDYSPCQSQQELLEAVWQLWLRHRDTAYAIGNVVFPVEARFFAACVAIDPAERAFLAPYPLLDLSSILYALGLDPLSDPLPEPEAMTHNALYDIAHDFAVLRKVRLSHGNL